MTAAFRYANFFRPLSRPAPLVRRHDECRPSRRELKLIGERICVSQDFVVIQYVDHASAHGHRARHAFAGVGPPRRFNRHATDVRQECLMLPGIRKKLLRGTGNGNATLRRNGHAAVRPWRHAEPDTGVVIARPWPLCPPVISLVDYSVISVQ
jgi:hypothetical protein